MKKYVFFLSLLSACFFCSFSLEAAWTFQSGKLTRKEEKPSLGPEDHLQLAIVAFKEGDWKEASHHFQIIISSFPDSPLVDEALFFQGVALYQLKEFDFSNDAFSSYLHISSHPKHFQEALEYKLAIAEEFRNGAKRHLLGTKQLPKWSSGWGIALKNYDEIIAAMPSHEMAAKALFGKGNILWSNREYREAVEAFQLLIKKFPKNDLSPESYIAIQKIYLQQAKLEFRNPDLLALAEINFKKFKQDFPKEERLEETEKYLFEIREVYAEGLYQTAQFYEKIGKPKASFLYYKEAVHQFPDTKMADLSQKRVDALSEKKP